VKNHQQFMANFNSYKIFNRKKFLTINHATGS